MFPAPNAYTPSPGTQRITIQSTRSNRYAFEIMVVQKQEWTEPKPSAPKLIKPCTHSGREPGPQLHDVKSQSPRSEALVGDVLFGLRAPEVLCGARTLRGRHWTDKQRQCASKILLYCSSHLHALAPWPRRPRRLVSPRLRHPRYVSSRSRTFSRSKLMLAAPSAVSS